MFQPPGLLSRILNCVYSLADQLVELGHLDATRHAAVGAIAGLQLQALGGDPEKSLAALSTAHTGPTLEMPALDVLGNR
jgi:hypothetical protein